jgi:hypothetical protein
MSRAPGQRLENQCVERVAEALELSEEAVKQRLSRGRKLLQDEFLAFAEVALARTKPGKVFTLGVLAALPALTLTAKAATLGAGIKGATGKTAATAAAASGLAGGPLFKLLPMLAGLWMGWKMTESPRERAFTRKAVIGLFLGALSLPAGIMLAEFLGRGYWETHKDALTLAILGCTIVFVVFIGFYAHWMARAQQRIRIDEVTYNKSKDEVRNRVQTVINGLLQIGIRGAQLNTKELGELYYNVYNPDTAVREPLGNFNDLGSPVIIKGQGQAPQPHLDRENQ